ncbi:MAG: aldehyde oxidase and xanthine dehydrogenase molybdopterin binding protein, partial [Acidobacteria bacterium]|nr:aldehyde oxidase and xanthine dehydrogenase molybdopterin binding protein [Acidobacteriota bacterium]
MADLAGVNGTRPEFKVVGKPNMPGRLSYSLATGKAKYGSDYVFPNMLFAKFLRSPYANAMVQSVDVAAAKKIPGVVDVVTWEDDDLKNFGRRGGGMMGGGAPKPDAGGGAPKSAPAAKSATVSGTQGSNPVAFGPPAAGLGMNPPQAGGDAAAKTAPKAKQGSSGYGGGMGFGGPQGPYVDQIADMEDDEVAVIVVAESEDICDEALKALNPKWEVRPFVVDINEGRKPDAPVIRDNPRGKGNVTIATNVQGDVEAGFKDADQVIEYDFNMPAFCGHIPNPPASVAYWYDDPMQSSDRQSLHIEGAVQRKDSVGGMFGLPAEMVKQEGLFQGGKYCDWGLRKTQEITPLLARRTGRPVRMACIRSEMYDFNMNQRFMHLKVGFKNNGLITAIDDFSVADAGVPPVSTLGTSGDQGYGPYFTTKCLNIKQTMEVVNSNRGKMYTSGQHCPFNWDSLTMAIHLIAEKLGKDPIDIATLNLHGPTSQKDTDPVPSYQACVEEGKKLMDWKWHAVGAKKLPDGRVHGASFRYQMCPRHSFSGYNCKLELKNGKVHMPTQGPCTGIYAVEGNAMVVAEELGLRYEDISIDFDYRETFTPVGGGSDGTTASAWATKECANVLKKQILEAAIQNANNPPAQGGFGGFGGGGQAAPSPLKGLTPADLDMKDGNIYVKSDPSKSVSLAQATRGANLFATYSGRPPTALWATGMGKLLDTMNIAMCEVAVDTETGQVEILRFGVVADPGKVIRLTSLESQIDQVMDFSAGCQLQEDYFYDKTTGVKLNSNMFDYKKVSMLDMPRVDMELLETRAGNACYGSNGISHSLA